jgi:hypothetical protein
MCFRCDEEVDWKLAAPYYRMAGLTPVEVVNRVKKMELPPELVTERKNQVCGRRWCVIMC